MQIENILFRLEYSEEYFPYQDRLISKFVGLLTDEFRSEIIEFIESETIQNLSQSSIVKCLYLEYLFTNDDLKVEFQAFSKKIEVLTEACSYYKWICKTIIFYMVEDMS